MTTGGTTEMTTVERPMLLPKLAAAAGLEPGKFYAAVKATCGCQGANDEHFAVLLMVADRYQLNPMLKQLYLMETKRGVQPVIPVDGWVPLLVNHHDYLAHEVVLAWEGEAFKTRCVAATCRIWTKTRNALGMGPFEHPELMAECYRETGPWKSHPTRMLGHKAIIQGTRRAFGIYVIDEDEARNIGEVLPKTLIETKSFRLPTGEAEHVNESVGEALANSTDAEDEVPTVDPQTIQSWKVPIDMSQSLEVLDKLRREFDESSANEAERVQIVELFDQRRAKLAEIPY